ncbi:MAG: hypothetical protein WDW36_004055 [Sanguina aurantia]
MDRQHGFDQQGNARRAAGGGWAWIAADMTYRFRRCDDRLVLVAPPFLKAIADNGDGEFDDLAPLARSLHAQGLLTGPVVRTLMSNFGLQLALAEFGVPLIRANVGDRYVMQLLQQHGGILGGETSGHILCLDRATTGDGIVAALAVLEQALAEVEAVLEGRGRVLLRASGTEPLQRSASRSAEDAELASAK